jgi:hypothetical protein
MRTQFFALLGAALLLGGCIRPLSIPAGTLSPAATPVDGSIDESAWPQAALVIRQALAQQLGVAPLDITLLAAEARTWPDVCLGAPRPSELCLPAATPGHRLVLAHGTDRYVYHTDSDAFRSRLVDAPAVQVGEPLIAWRQTDDEGQCRAVAIGARGVAFGPCEGVQMRGIYGQPERRLDLTAFVETYAPFTATTPAGDVEFRGEGTQTAAPAEQRMLAEWARLVALEAEAGRSGASWGLALAWHRENQGRHTGAPACDDVTIYVTGDVYVASCVSDPAQTVAHFRLGAAELERLYAFVDTYAGFEQAQGEQRLLFSGAGNIEAPADAIAAMAAFAQQQLND